MHVPWFKLNDSYTSCSLLTSDHWSSANKLLKVPSHYYRYTSNNRLPSSSSMVTVTAGGLSVICESDVLS